MQSNGFGRCSSLPESPEETDRAKHEGRKVSVVRIQARVVRSSAGWVWNFARAVLSLAVAPVAAPGVTWFMVLASLARLPASEGLSRILVLGIRCQNAVRIRFP